MVVPFHGDRAGAEKLLSRLGDLRRRPDDELIVADNTDGRVVPGVEGVQVVAASGEHSPAYARNAGADRARGDWLLFIDADCVPAPSILDDYFQAPVAADTGALAGGVDAAPAVTLAGRYASYRGHLDQWAHAQDPYRPRAATANLLVRRAAWSRIGGFSEGVKAGEDADFCWRLQEDGWRLELREQARALHEHRDTLAGLRAQWRGYGAAGAWLDRRHPASRAPRRLASTIVLSLLKSGLFALTARSDRAIWSLFDATIAAEQAIGTVLSNRPGPAPVLPLEAAVLIGAERGGGTPTVGAVEAPGRALRLDRAQAVPVVYREDDGVLACASACAGLLLRHPLRVRAVGLRASLPLAASARRLIRARCGELVPAPGAEQAARRLAQLSGACVRHVG